MIPHVYKHGFSTLPDLKKILDSQVFDPDQNFDLLKEKKESLNKRNCFFEQNISTEIYDVAASFLKKYHPQSPSGSYLDIARTIPEDLIIHRFSEGRDWLASAHVCVPSGWKPEEKIGLSFREIHKPVPMDLKNSEKLVKAIIKNNYFERYLWSVVSENRYDYHPNNKFDSFSGKIWVKIERQVTVGFESLSFCLFILRPYLIPEEQIDFTALANSIKEMTKEERVYKNLQDTPEFEYIVKR